MPSSPKLVQGIIELGKTKLDIRHFQINEVGKHN